MEEENKNEQPEEKKEEPVVEEPKPELKPEPVKEIKPKERPAWEKKLQEKFSGKMPSFKINWNIKTWPAKLMHIFREYKRVIIVSKKPTIEELSEISKISGIGLILIGLIGFILQTIFKFFV